MLKYELYRILYKIIISAMKYMNLFDTLIQMQMLTFFLQDLEDKHCSD